MSISSRIFMLIGVAVVIGLLLRICAVGAHLFTHDRLGVQRDDHDDDGSILVNVCLMITQENKIIVVNLHTDMGQGNATGLMQIVAYELDAVC